MGSEEEMDDMPISNPLPPPPRPQGKNNRRESLDAAAARAENLSNADFRKMVMDTPRRGEDKQKERPRGLDALLLLSVLILSCFRVCCYLIFCWVLSVVDLSCCSILH